VDPTRTRSSAHPAAAFAGRLFGWIVFTALVLGVLLLASMRGHGVVDCVPTTPAEDLRRADAVFLGRFESARPSLHHPLTRVVYGVRMLRSWKGVDRQRVNLEFEFDERWMGSDQFVHALRGDRYSLAGETLMIAAVEEDGRLVTMSCGIMWVARPGKEPPTALGPGTVPTR
jgi:hypothetical protein